MELGWGITNFLPFVIYVAAISAVIVTIFYKIEVGIYFFVFFLPLQNVLNYAQKYPFGKDLNDILLIAMLLGWIVNKRKTGEPFFEKTPINFIIIVLTIWTYVETWRGASYLGLPPPFTTNNSLFVSWKNYMFSPLIYLIVVNNIKNQKQIKILVLIMVLSILVLDRNFYNVIRYRDTSHYDANALKVNVEATALGGNWLAVFLAQYSAVVLSLFLLDNHKWRKIYYLGPVLFSYYCIMFLFSRSGYLATAASCLTIGLIKDKRILIGLIVIFFFWTALLPTAVQERIKMTRTEEGWDGTTRERLEMWEQAKAMIAEQPVLGVGFDVTSKLAVKAAEFEEYTWNSFHNNYLQTTVEIGIIGLSIVLWLYILGFRAGWRLFKIADNGFSKGLGLGIMACVPAILCGNIAGSYWQYYNIIGYFYVFLALVVRSTIFIEREMDGFLSEQENIEEPEYSFLPMTQLTEEPTVASRWDYQKYHKI